MPTAASLAHADTNNLEPFFMPFTANRSFKADPRLIVGAEGVHYIARDGRRILDASAGLWCVNAGHCRKTDRRGGAAAGGDDGLRPHLPDGASGRLRAGIPHHADHAAGHGFGVLRQFRLGGRGYRPQIAIAWHRARGEGHRTRLIGRERGYHGVGFGGTSVGGIKNNRKAFGMLLPGVDHLPHTLDLDGNAFSRGEPEHGLHLADRLERIVDLHDASTIAAVIVEPVAGSIGVYPPPKGYLKRLREICDRHGILLIFDEVITGFGRLGAAFASERFGVTPDMMTLAKGLTNGTVPASAVVMKKDIYDTFMTGPDWMVELTHGYTYSAHPLAVAAGLATLDIYRDEGLFERSASLSPVFEDAVHSLEGLAHVIDVRNIGLMGAVEFAPRSGEPGRRGYDVFLECWRSGVYCRQAGDTLAFSPPFIIEEGEIGRIFEIVADAVRRTD